MTLLYNKAYSLCKGFYNLVKKIAHKINMVEAEKSNLSLRPKYISKTKFFIMFNHNQGITPANAGKTVRILTSFSYRQDHSRVCGKKFLFFQSHLLSFPIFL